MAEGRIRTYVRGLDEMMQGGVPRGFVVLVCGHTGTMKSSFCFNMIYQGAKMEGRRALYLTLEQGRESIIEHMEKLQMPIGDVDEVTIIDLGRLRKDEVANAAKAGQVDWASSIISTLKSYKEMFGCEVLVFDSLAALYALTEFKNPRGELFHFFEKLRDLGLTVFLISEMPTDREVFGLYGVEDFLSDGIIHLCLKRVENTSNLYVNINKMRQTNHDKSFFPLIFEDGGFSIVST